LKHNKYKSIYPSIYNLIGGQIGGNFKHKRFHPITEKNDPSFNNSIHFLITRGNADAREEYFFRAQTPFRSDKQLPEYI
jgi:hypothetical protein